MSSEQGSGYQAIIYKQKSERLEAYRSCMGERMKDKQFPTREGRWKHFAVSARLCSGKSKDEKEAIEYVKKKHPEYNWSE